MEDRFINITEDTITVSYDNRCIISSSGNSIDIIEIFVYIILVCLQDGF